MVGISTPPPGGTASLGGRDVSRIGFGAMQLAAPSEEDAAAVLRAVVDAGVTHIDTAAFYGPGIVNERIRRALAPYPEDLVIVSKVGARYDGDAGHLVAAQRPDELRDEVERNLETLGVDRIDVVNLRRMDDSRGVVATGDQVVPLEDQLAALVELRDEGTIGAIGVSTVDRAQLEAALPVGIVCVQNAYSVIQRDDEDLLALCAAEDIRWVPYFPLGSAFPQFPKVGDDPVVRGIAERIGATPAQVGLAWQLAHSPGTLLIPGTSSIGHLRDNLAVADIVLDAEAMGELDTLS